MNLSIRALFVLCHARVEEIDETIAKALKLAHQGMSDPTYDMNQRAEIMESLGEFLDTARVQRKKAMEELNAAQVLLKHFG